MGIKNLNKYFMEKCSTTAIHKIGFHELQHQTIIVDVSIYLYKFTERGSFLENMYLFISMFREYGIVPVFVFDGKPPAEKKELLEKRKTDKHVAELKFAEIQQRVVAMESADVRRDMDEMDDLKKQFVRLNDRDIRNAKLLMQHYGVNYIEARGEADELCAYLVKHGYAWGCMSDDMDMFMYGCPRVIRHVSLMNHTAVVYDTSRILRELDMPFAGFKDALVLSGTDYNIHSQNEVDLITTMKWYDQYRYSYNPYATGGLSFYDWLEGNTDYLRDREKLRRVHAMFDLSIYAACNQEFLKEITATMTPFKNKLIQMSRLKEIMEGDGFIF